MADTFEVADGAMSAADAALRRLDAAVHDPASLSQGEWLAVAGHCQALVNRLAAVQSVAVARAARFEQVVLDDGTLGTHEHGPGRVALDAADLVAPHLGVSHHQAQNVVEAAVRRTGREPVPAECDERPGATGLGGLHDAMRAGRLDAYRAGVVADELVEAPAAVAEAVVAALDPHLGTEPAAGLRRRARRVLARLSPDLLRQRAQRARRETGLRRWVAEPGVDAWHGTFPSEDSAAAWAAVDRLARQYVTDGVCSTIEQARGRALTDLVTQQADVQVRLVLTTPAEAAPAAGALDAVAAFPASTPGDAAPEAASGAVGDLVQVTGIRPSEPMLVERGWLERVGAAAGTTVVTQPCHPGSGALVDVLGGLARDGYRPGKRLTAMVTARDGRCRFPGCSVAARFCDLDHVRPWPGGPTDAANLLCLCRRHHRIKQLPGWSVRLAPDGTATWKDPTGRVRTTEPLDALALLVLRADPADPADQADAAAPAAAVPELPSVLEESFERVIEQYRVALRHRATAAAAAPAIPPPQLSLDDAPPF
ncbi:HNH endonuclease signature motif containing protein [Phycicoccus duodecadis]|uniref:HNH nuclease domain-containing protein n=1 Tax=Phycicoccus duodecadis TaxID=173053 RepID=A0A2N3YMK6_9MICO|nr:HNH endonuclease signature motif containing protein [Phycicoccus duodecadis]PKW28082.1 hypothetical protein ATL31_2937 [Phycicoccus duodecadis]